MDKLFEATKNLGLPAKLWLLRHPMICRIYIQNSNVVEETLAQLEQIRAMKIRDQCTKQAMTHLYQDFDFDFDFIYYFDF